MVIFVRLVICLSPKGMTIDGRLGKRIDRQQQHASTR